MLTAHVHVPLRALRHLKKGQAWKHHVDQGDAELQPPKDCGDDYQAVCSMSLWWDGTVTFTRTK